MSRSEPLRYGREAGRVQNICSRPQRMSPQHRPESTEFGRGALRLTRPNLVAHMEIIIEKISIKARFGIHVVTLRIHHNRVDPVLPEILNIESMVLGCKA